MKKKYLVIALALTLVSALAIGTASTVTATAATTKKATATPTPKPKAIVKATPTPTPKAKAKATPTPKPKKELMVDGVKVNDLLTGKYNDIKTVVQVVEYGSTVFSRNKAVLSENVVKFDRIYEYDKKSYRSASYFQRVADVTKLNSDFRCVYSEDLEYNKLYWSGGSNGYSLVTLDTRKEEIAKWKLELSRFETKETKLTDTEIIIKGTYTLTPPNNAYRTKERTKLVGINIIDDAFWDDMTLGADEVLHEYFKDVKCDTTLVFNRDTKQITSLELKPKLPKDGYPTTSSASIMLKSSNHKYTFEHNLTEEQLAKLTEAEIISGKVNKFDSVETLFECNYSLSSKQPFYYDVADTIPREYVNPSGFDLSRFKITSSETDKNIVTITGTYKINENANTLYDAHVNQWINKYYILDNVNDITADVTIVFDAKTKSMKKVTLQYNVVGTEFRDENYKKIDFADLVCSHTFTFEVTPEPIKAPTPTPDPKKKPTLEEEKMITGKYNTSTTIQSNYTWIAYYAGEDLEFVANDASTITITKDGLKSSGSYKSNLKATGWELNYKHNSTFKYGETKWKYTDSTGDSWEDEYVKLTKDITKFGFDFSRFKVNKSETSKDTITITGTYTLSKNANTIYDMYALDLLATNDIVGNINKVTANVTITLDANTKAMKKAVLEYSMNGEIFGPEYNGRLSAFIDSYTHTFTFK